MKKWLEIVVVTGLFFLAIIIVLLMYKDDNYKYYNEGLLYINEIMASNKYTITDDKLNYSDYIEIYNGYDEDIDLNGYYLSDSDSYNEKWMFPSVTIKAGEYLLVYASGDNSCSDNICHTNFKLNKGGGSVSLTNKNRVLISKIRYNETDSDTSYGYNGHEYVYYYRGTPGEVNSDESSVEGIFGGNSLIKLSITEYTNNNLSIISDKDKDYVSVVELYNDNNFDVNLKGFHLSDSISKPNKFTFSDVVIKSKDYLLVYLSGKDKYDGEVHTNFVLTTDDKVLLLSTPQNELIDNVEIMALNKNMVASLYNGKWLYSYTNTFGKSNANDGDDKIVNEKIDKSIVINEVSSNAIELRNVTNKSINLKDYGLSGNGTYVMKFPNITIGANKYLVLYESNSYSYKNGVIYTGFKINTTNEKITLYDNNNRVIDSFTSGKMTNSNSYGINESGERVVYTKKTLGYSNSSIYYKGYSSSVNFSSQGGYVSENTKVVLNTNDDSTIYYTLDGSFPTTKSIKYQEPINISKTTVIKAISYKDGFIDSDAVSRTYFVGRKHDMAVVSLSTDSSNLFSSKTGILHNNNYKKDWERKISFEFYENDGNFGVMFNGGTKLTGQDSRNFPQKSMAIYLRSNYGINEITYPFFTDHDVTTFSSFTLRNSGEDVVSLKFKDAFLVEVLKGQMDLDYQYYRPVVVYINGEYYGIYNIREKINESYLENNHNVDGDNVDLIKGINTVSAGSITNYNSMRNYIKTHDMTKKSNYEYIKTQIDIQELINYWVVQTYYCNYDTGNIRFWRERTTEGKWRWVLYDLDWAMHPATYRTPKLNYIFKNSGHGSGNSFTTNITYNLLKNSEFRDLYFKTFAKHMETTFKPERMLKIFDQVKSLYEKEMPYHVDRWYNDFKNSGDNPLTMSRWNNNIASEKKVITNRYSVVKNNLRSQFNLSNSAYKKYFGNL